ncbi:putative NRPS-like protein biosynthetic cluster [Onygenales sp. PD_10]|nr:putative NRPS-like protein biosynthetic cluster [Onygenales sp. PD_10]
MANASFEPAALSTAVDRLKETNPTQLFCIHPVSSDISQGWRNVTMKDLSRAMDYMCDWIEKNVTSSSAGETLAYMGANDVRYVAFFLACMKLGHTALLLSSRNSLQASSHVMAKTDCSKIVFTVERERQINELRNAHPALDVWNMPDLWDVFGDIDVPVYPTKDLPFNDVEDDVGIIIHSSGTTGLPKPVPLTHGYWATTGALPYASTPPGRLLGAYCAARPGDLTLTMSPFFHFMGLCLAVASISTKTPFVLSPEKPMTIELFARIMNETGPKTAVLSPSILEDLAATELGLETLSKLDYIGFGGAPLSAEIGDKISKATRIQTVLGSSECGMFQSLLCEDPEDWGYFEWNPFCRVDMEDSGDGTFELVVPRPESRELHGVFHVYKDIQEYRTGDLFVPHPRKANLWKYIGRGDDVIVLSNGEKFNPTTMETMIQGHPLVSKAVVIGQGRFQSALLVEPNWDHWKGEESDFVNAIWPVVQKANESAPGHARLMKTRIGLSSPSKLFQTTPKGTIRRRTVIEDYKDEIEVLYSKSDDELVIQIPKDATPKEIAPSVKDVISYLLPTQKIDDDSDIFALGVDSLQSLQLGQILQNAVRAIRPQLSNDAFSSRQVYSHPSVSTLAQYIHDLIQGKDTTDQSTAVMEDDATRSTKLSALVSKYTAGLGETHSVILTGSTGSLGSYLLHELLEDSAVAKVYCLNRSEDAAPRQMQSFQEKGLSSVTAFASRVEFLHAKFGEEQFGLGNDVYERLLQSVDTIIHNAWKVNFNHQVEAFEHPHIVGVRRFVDFSLASAHRAHIHFISSISTVEGWDSAKRGPFIPEEIFEEADVVMRTGYGESKHVSERICAFASARCDVPTSIHRVGQIGGPTTEKGMWNKQEWFPSLVATSKTIKQLPSSLGSISVEFIPVDTIARVITDILVSRRKTEKDVRCAAFHLVNPTAASWESLIPAITKHFPVEIVDPQTWIASLEAFSNPTQSDLQDKPALKILDFFRGVYATGGGVAAKMETKKTQEASEAMRVMKPIDQGILDTWMRQWVF